MHIGAQHQQATEQSCQNDHRHENSAPTIRAQRRTNHEFVMRFSWNPLSARIWTAGVP